MLQTKTSLLTLAVLSALSAPNVALAATFCEDRQGWLSGAVPQTGVLNGDQCVEISSGNIGTEDEYFGTGHDMTLMAGSKVSLQGYLTDSTAKAGSELYVTKKSLMTGDPYEANNIAALASNLIIEKDALVRAYVGGRVEDSYIEGQLNVFTGSDRYNDAGSASNNTVANGGKIYVYDQGLAFGNIIANGGAELVQTEGHSTGAQIKQGGVQQVYQHGLSTDALVMAGGEQIVTDNGVATATTIGADGLQAIHSGGLATHTLIEANGLQSVYDSGLVQDSTIKGTQTLFKSEAGALAADTSLFDQGTQKVYADASTHNTHLNDQSKSLIASGAKATGTTVINDQAQLQLFAAAGNNGAYAQNVQLNGGQATLSVIAAHNDADSSRVDALSGQGKVQFVNNDQAFSRLNIGQLSGNMQFLFHSAIQDGRGDYVVIDQATGQHGVTVADTGKEITRPDQTTLDLITAKEGDAGFDLASLSGANISAVEGGIYMYQLDSRQENGETIWFLKAITDDAGPEPGKPDPGKPTTLDAMAAMASAPQFIFNNELSNLRLRRGNVVEERVTDGVWGRVLGGKTNLNTDHTSAKLAQTGFEVGVDKLFNHTDGQTYVGLFASYGNADLKHNRGGKSSIDSISTGVYATYLHNNGFYADGVLKFNRFKNDVSFDASNGANVGGKYNQNAFGAAFEVGFNRQLSNEFFVEPYARLSMLKVGDKGVTLSNGMDVQVENHKSVQAEAGLHLGKTITAGANTFKPYVKVAVANEFLDNNKVVFNQKKTLVNDFSGSVGKFGVGLNAKIGKQTHLFTELSYQKGSRVEAPLQGNLGLRYTF